MSAGPQQLGAKPLLTVERSPEWLRASAGRLAPYLQKALPPLCAHPSTRVRAELAACEFRLNVHASSTLLPRR